MLESLLKALLESFVYSDPIAYMYWLDAKQDVQPEAASDEQPQASFTDDRLAGHPQLVGRRPEVAG